MSGALLVAGARAGDRVAVDPNIMCGRCAYCRRGLVQLCPNITPLGIARPGGFAEYSLVPEANAYAIPDAMTFDQAALVEPLACCVRGIGQADVQLADGSSGIDAVHDILPSANVPVIFITAFPERLLTGERSEPAYLIAKPWQRQGLGAEAARALVRYGFETLGLKRLIALIDPAVALRAE